MSAKEFGVDGHYKSPTPHDEEENAERTTVGLDAKIEHTEIEDQSTRRG